VLFCQLVWEQAVDLLEKHSLATVMEELVVAAGDGDVKPLRTTTCELHSP